MNSLVILLLALLPTQSEVERAPRDAAVDRAAPPNARNSVPVGATRRIAARGALPKVGSNGPRGFAFRGGGASQPLPEDDATASRRRLLALTPASAANDGLSSSPDGVFSAADRFSAPVVPDEEFLFLNQGAGVDSNARVTPDRTVIRGQTPGPEGQMLMLPPSGMAQAPGAPATPFYNPFAPPPVSRDPFLDGGDGSAANLPLSAAPLTKRPAAERFGWNPRADFGYILPARTSPETSRMSQYEFDAELKHIGQRYDGIILAHTPQFGWRQYDGGIGHNFYRFGWNIEASLPRVGPWTFQGGFNPSLNSDLDRNFTIHALNLDAYAMAGYQCTPETQLILGLGYWDRVNDIFLPYGGVVWTPDERWEFRLTFPKTRISYYVGEILGETHWLYVGNEYHVDSFQLNATGGQVDQVQVADFRATLGVMSETSRYTKYVEVGWVYDRRVKFIQRKDFTVGDALMIRAGIRF